MYLLVSPTLLMYTTTTFGLPIRLSSISSNSSLVYRRRTGLPPTLCWKEIDSNHRSRALSYTVKGNFCSLGSFGQSDLFVRDRGPMDAKSSAHRPQHNPPCRRSRSPPPPPTADHFPPTPLHPRRLSFSLESPPA